MQERLPARIVKNPFIWGGTGMVIRYASDRSTYGAVMLSLGVLALGGGLMYAIQTHSHDPAQRWRER